MKWILYSALVLALLGCSVESSAPHFEVITLTPEDLGPVTDASNSTIKRDTRLSAHVFGFDTLRAHTPGFVISSITESSTGISDTNVIFVTADSMTFPGNFSVRRDFISGRTYEIRSFVQAAKVDLSGNVVTYEAP